MISLKTLVENWKELISKFEPSEGDEEVSLMNTEGIRVILPEGQDISVISTGGLELLKMKARGYDSIMSERDKDEKVVGLDDDRLSFGSIMELMEEMEELAKESDEFLQGLPDSKM
jgi:hypothetical protein